MKLVDTKHVKISVRKTTTKEKIEASIVILILAAFITWKVMQ